MCGSGERGEEFLERAETNGVGHKEEKLQGARPQGWTVGALRTQSTLGAKFRFCKKNNELLKQSCDLMTNAVLSKIIPAAATKAEESQQGGHAEATGHLHDSK